MTTATRRKAVLLKMNRVAQTQIAALETQINAQYVYLDSKGKLLVSHKFVGILSASTASLNGQRFAQ